MPTEATAAATGSRRPRPILLVLLAVVVAGFLLMRLGGSAPPATTGTPARAPQQGGGQEPLDPSKLDVHLESLAGERPGPGDSERNPFRFQAKEPRPAPGASGFGPPAPGDDEPAAPPGPPPPPPITVKYLGTIEVPDRTVRAVFTDCTAGRRTEQVPEGGRVLGQYRLVKIGLQSVVIEHLDGSGRTTLAITGQDCVWK